MADNSFIKLYRKIEEWEWYRDIPTKCLFWHILIKANYEEKFWRGIRIDGGEFITSLPKLSHEIGLSIQQTRTALSKLKSTGEITYTSTKTYTHIKLQNWQEYQQQSTKKPTRNQHDNNTRSNFETTTTKEVDTKVSTKKQRIEPDFFLYKEGNEFQDPFWYIYSNFIIEKREVLDECFKMSVFVENNERFQWKQFVTNWIIKSYKRRPTPLSKDPTPDTILPTPVLPEKSETFHVTDLLKDEEPVDA